MPTESVTFVRNSGSGFTPEGDPVIGTDTSTTVTGCLVADSRAAEQTERGREGAVGDWTVYMPPGFEPLRTDRVTIRGVDCTVEGFAEDWRSGLPWQYVVHAKRVG